MSAVFNRTHLNQPVHTDKEGDGTVTINKEGSFSHYPTGFCDYYDKLLDKLLEFKVERS